MTYTWYSKDKMDALLAPHRNPNTIAFLGDSITAYNGTGDAVAKYHNYQDNYSHFITTISNGRLKFGGAFATAGYTVAQIRDTVLPRLLAQPAGLLPGTVVLLGGTNDVGSGVPQATTISAINDIYTTLRANGIELVLSTIPPRSDSTTANALVGPLNNAIARFAQEHSLQCLPFHAALVNPADGKYLSGYDIDGVHPSRLGMIAMAQAAIDAGLSDRFPSQPSLTVKSAIDPTNLLAQYGLFLTDSNADGLADGWSTGGDTAYTPSLVAPIAADRLAGNWQRFTVSATGGGSSRWVQYVNSLTKTSPTATDWIELSFRVRLTGATTGLTTPKAWNATLGVRGGANDDATLVGFSVDIADGVVTIRDQLNADDTAYGVTFNLALPISGSVIMDVGEVTVKNLTALGLA